MEKQIRLQPHVLLVLSRAHYGLTAHQLHAKIPEYEGTKQELQVNLHSMIRRGLVRIDGRMECAGCGREHVVYRITDKAKERVP